MWKLPSSPASAISHNSSRPDDRRAGSDNRSSTVTARTTGAGATQRCGSDQPARAIAGKSITERLCVFRLDETEHHKIELAATQGFAAC
jgi:hypothetical protein